MEGVQEGLSRAVEVIAHPKRTVDESTEYLQQQQ